MHWENGKALVRYELRYFLISDIAPPIWERGRKTKPSKMRMVMQSSKIENSYMYCDRNTV